jgi:hypothetical protein
MTLSPTPTRTDPRGNYTAHAKNLKDIPEGEHWVILSEDSVSTTSGYENDSRSETVFRYHVFTDEQTWRDRVLAMEQAKFAEQSFMRPNPFIAYRAGPRARARVTVEVVEPPCEACRGHVAPGKSCYACGKKSE